MNTLIDLFETFEERGEKTVFVNRTGIRRIILTYREFHLLSLKMAALLADKGVTSGDRVLLWGPNSSWWGIAWWGTILLGAVAVPVDFMAGPERAENIRNLTEAKVVIQSRFKPDRLAFQGALLFEELQYLLEETQPAGFYNHPAPEATAQLIYTSGTTGNPKGVILTHRNLIANMIQISRHVPIITPDFNFLSLLPLSHMFEQMGGFFTPLYAGGAIVYPRTLKPSAIMEALAEENIYALIAVPRLMQLLKTSVEQALREKHLDLAAARLRTLTANLPRTARKLLFYPVQRKFGKNFTVFVSGGAPLAPELFNFWNDTGFTLLEGYGLTECSPVLTVNTVEKQVAGSVGPPLPGVELKLLSGEVTARGENIFPGYYRNEDATRAAFTGDGWFRTGDMGEIGPDGWVTIKGREKEMIVTAAGINVYPDDIEAVLNRLDGVRESCVIGLEKQGGEEVHAVLLLDERVKNPGDIVAKANRSLDALQQINGFTVWPEDDFPKTTTMKIKKFEVKEKIKTGESGKSGPESTDRLINLIARITGNDATDVHEESLLARDLGLTSIARVELVNYLEQEYRMDIDESRIGTETRVRDLREMIAKREKFYYEGHFRLWTNSSLVKAVRKIGDILILHPFVRHFAKPEVFGLEHLEKLEGPLFFVSNHLSYFDQPTIMLSLPPKFRYHTASAAWAEFFFDSSKPLFERIWKRIAYEAGTLLLNLFPLPQQQGFGSAMKFMGKLADNGINILIFPEGQHSRSGKLLPFQMGLGVMVRELEVPVVPLKIIGTEKVLPHDAKWPKSGKVTVTFGKPLYFKNDEPGEIVKRAREAVEAL
ncbi:MAG: AMP-binding protein [Geobacteraceae bacterium GWC2_48_7]|nr:MAG: AMP-binding protein [Geobacteraceae bacterium GWC2_48_7]